jgi:hypothetical protein
MTTVVVVQVFQAQASRSSKESVFQVAPLSNPGLLAATSVIVFLVVEGVRLIRRRVNRMLEE